MAISHSRGRSDYEVEERLGGDSGKLETDLAGIHPYANMEWGNGYETWAILSIGESKAELRH